MAGQIKQRKKQTWSWHCADELCGPALGNRSMISNERKFANNASFVNSISSLPVELVVTVFTTIRRNMHHQLVWWSQLDEANKTLRRWDDLMPQQNHQHEAAFSFCPKMFWASGFGRRPVRVCCCGLEQRKRVRVPFVAFWDPCNQQEQVQQLWSFCSQHNFSSGLMEANAFTLHTSLKSMMLARGVIHIWRPRMPVFTFLRQICKENLQLSRSTLKVLKLQTVGGWWSAGGSRAAGMSPYKLVV